VKIAPAVSLDDRRCLSTLPSGRAMTFPWFPLFLNFLLLAAAIFICNTMNTGRATPVWNGPLLFIGFCILAMTLDVVLTMVLASATTTDRDRYVDLSSLGACGERALAYAIPCAVAALLALRFWVRTRQPTVVIHTSEYTTSELRI
jgi:hypothetical protein